MALILGVMTWVLCKWGGMKVWHAIVCVMFGFTLASTGVAPYIGDAMTAILGPATG
ncbi:hypothetical protein AB0M43_32280 [Longispora sp. NPDC051575]|uniref:hypothetical protein n=1 Tax=Longispora sp. NPDC051575 TaxID=3154943 RepID=UPI003441CE38